jgi:hypothetical protein
MHAKRVASLFSAISTLGSASIALGSPLQASPTNPRYFTDGSGQAILLTGAYTWTVTQDYSLWPTMDFNAFLTARVQEGHNFIRFRFLNNDNHLGEVSGIPNPNGTVSPIPFQRTGPGKANDGKPKYDLSKFDTAYFDRIASRVNDAKAQGIYVSVMLFDGHWVNDGQAQEWQYNFYNPANNVNGFNVNQNEVYSLTNAGLVALQEQYVRKIVDTLNQYDNVLYEIINEAPLGSNDWQYHMVDLIHSYENGLPNHHPVGMTSFDYTTGKEPSNIYLANGPSDWISLSGPADQNNDYSTNILAANSNITGGKVSMLDTDHISGDNTLLGAGVWVWKAFTRGHNPIYQDRNYNNSPPTSSDIEFKAAIGYARALANRMDLAHMDPNISTATTGYALVHRSLVEYLVYQPTNNIPFSVNLPQQTFNFEWIDPASGSVTDRGSFTNTSGIGTFTPPAGYTKGALLHLVTPATLTVVSSTQLANGHIILQCLGVANASNRIEASDDLSGDSFATVISITADGAGAFQYEDVDAASFPSRFYRLAFP